MVQQSERPSRRKLSVQDRSAMALFKKSPLISFLLVLGGISAAVLYIVVPSNRPPTIDHTNAGLVEMGKRIYSAECANCHGPNLEGQPNWQSRLANGKLPAPPHDASGHTWHHSDQVLFDITKRGPEAYPSGYSTDMPAYRDRLSDQQIAAVLSFIKSTWSAEILRRQPKPRN